MSKETIGFPSQVVEQSITDIFNDPNIENKSETSVNRVIEMTSAWWQEYIAKYPVISFPLEIRAGKLYQPRWQDNLVNVTKREERNGAPYESVLAIEDFLVNSPGPALGFFTSPPGDSGLFYGGKEVVYTQSQTYIYHKDLDGKLTAFTLVTDLNTDETAELIKTFSPEISIPHTPENVTRTPITSSELTPTQVIEAIIKIESQRWWKSKDKPIDWKQIAHLANHLEEADNAWGAFTEAQSKLKDYKNSVLEEEALHPNDTDFMLSFIVNGAIHLVTDIEELSRNEHQKSQTQKSAYGWADNAGTTSGTCSSFGTSAIFGAGGWREVTVISDCPKIACKKCSWEAKNEDFDPNTKELKHKCCPNCGWKPGDSV